MLVKGKPVAWTTGENVEKLQENLIRSYFHLPLPSTKARKR